MSKEIQNWADPIIGYICGHEVRYSDVYGEPLHQVVGNDGE